MPYDITPHLTPAHTALLVFEQEGGQENGFGLFHTHSIQGVGGIAQDYAVGDMPVA